MKRAACIAASLCAFALAGCKREQRVFDPGLSGSHIANGVAVNEVHAGGPLSVSEHGPYEESAYAVGEGKRLFSAFNCVGCHNHGGGGIGPALMDAKWIYGSHPEQIYSSIVQGRPDGMPSFAGRIPDYQVWELVAYVRSLSGQLPTDIAPGRSDEIQVKKAEQAKTREHAPDESPQNIEKRQP